MHAARQTGELEVICGSMFSGKSEELIRRIRRATYGHLSVRVFKPAIDNRYEQESVVSHDGSSAIARPIDKPVDILTNLEENVDIVGIDEGQFFDDSLLVVVDELARKGIRVIVAGLDMNFRGEPFHPIPALMAYAEEVTKLNAICPVCGMEASRTQRLIDGKPASYDDPTILVGASESYEPRCRKHHDVPNRPTVSVSELTING